jgi:putative transposase
MSSVKLSITEGQQLEVEQMMRKTKSRVQARRCRIVLLLARGHRVQEVQDKVGCVRSTVYHTLYRFEDAGPMGLRDGRSVREPSKATAQVRQRLLAYLDDAPQDYGWQRPTWTRELLALQLEADCGVRLSCPHLGRVLREEKCRRGRPRPALRIPIAGRRKRLDEIERLVARASPEDEVFYVDEADIDLNPRIGLAYIKRGVQPLVLTPGKNVKYYLAGALSPRTGRVVYTHGPRKNSTLFVSLLDELRRTYRRAATLHLVLDNYIIHKSRQTLRALAAMHGKIELHFLPPYSPEHNPIEGLWKQLHDNVTRNHRHTSMESLWKDATQFMYAVQPYPGTKVSTLRAAV